ncbi:MAG: hypothetical protein IJE89_04800 [Bacilli bacterium]|nr:hypothetical protein [Bacilli bacterium]
MKYYYCFSSKNNLFKEEIEFARILDLLIIYDFEKDIFLDKDNNEINIKDMLILPRTTIKDALNLLDAIKRHGGNSLVSKEDYHKTLNWPYYIKTKRNNIILTGREIISNPKFIIGMFGMDKVFFKTKNKNFSGVVEVSELLDNNSPFYFALKEHLDEDFIISSFVNIEKDQDGLLEYRAFIINGEIHNISRNSDSLLSDIPNEVITELENIVKNLKKTDFPNSYVLDLIVYSDLFWNKTIDVLECNPIIASRAYCTINTTKPSIFYSLPGGFASSLISFYSYDSNYKYEETRDINTRKLLNDNCCRKR